MEHDELVLLCPGSGDVCFPFEQKSPQQDGLLLVVGCLFCCCWCCCEWCRSSLFFFFLFMFLLPFFPQKQTKDLVRSHFYSFLVRDHRFFDQFPPQKWCCSKVSKRNLIWDPSGNDWSKHLEDEGSCLIDPPKKIVGPEGKRWNTHALKLEPRNLGDEYCGPFGVCRGWNPIQLYGDYNQPPY